MTLTSSRTRAGLLAAVFLGSFMALLDVSVVSVALPTMQRTLGASFSGLQWIVDGYTVALTAVILTGGTLGDRYGRKRGYLTGLTVFTIASVGCALAPTLEWLVAARVVQGFAASAVIPGAVALLAHAYPEPGARAKVMGLWGTVAGCALVLGPLLGGPLTDAFGWPAIFLVNVPIGLVAVLTGRRGITESRDPAHGALDLTGQVLGALWIGLLTFAVIEAGRTGFDTLTVTTGVLGFAALAAFIVVELRVPHPMLPVRLFAGTRFSVAIFAAWSLGFAAYPAVFLIGVYLQQARGATATEAGVQMLPYVLANVVAAFAAGRLSARFGAHRLLPVSYFVASVGSFAFLVLEADSPYWVVAVAFAVAGAGVGLSITPSNIVGLAGLPGHRSGIASATVNAARQTGTALGVAALGALLARGSTLPAGLHLAMGVAGIVLLAVTVLTAATLGGAGRRTAD
ncbi:DHA2 family efflux MFS transporter permease subunit [Amycolatopsis nalaikhensis]|uniref:DHA2 family efflux MFS transporter permease subunit n=1 Tax=Amycolatopsis nalaikhensis TaxID=715472 RepID=A0ABY8XX23_9PSEU|nr:DHA2 family efflux MFS transporter permease subunit [Amycolatopsis sp. 2-2]WIV59935.1 DHA2 family efflux MFS transporter permease subunit [Amycolatopsis sp. 2-2]